jgi:murein DD-endopeptidase MepM/ murein hydrolase activator NlpD
MTRASCLGTLIGSIAIASVALLGLAVLSPIITRTKQLDKPPTSTPLIQSVRARECDGKTWAYPVRTNDKRITATYGFMSKDSDYSRQMRKAGALAPGATSVFHPGVDFAARVGDPVLSVSDGVVLTSSYNDLYGKHLVIETNNIKVLYAHLSRITVKPGAKIACGQHIGDAGASGTALTGSHLHLETRIASDEPFDPMTMIEATLSADGVSVSVVAGK